jgi:hypothetical protein
MDGWIDRYVDTYIDRQTEREKGQTDRIIETFQSFRCDKQRLFMITCVHQTDKTIESNFVCTKVCVRQRYREAANQEWGPSQQVQASAKENTEQEK